MERRAQKLKADRSWSRSVSTVAPLSASWSFVILGYFFAGWQLILLYAALSTFDYRSIILAIISILFFVGATVLAARHTIVLWQYFTSLVAKCVLLLVIASILGLISKMWWGIHLASQ